MAGLTDGMAAVVFDFYGTLTPVSRAEVWTDHVSQLAAAFGVAPQDVVRALDESYPERFTGALGDARQTLKTLASRMGVQASDQQLDEAHRLRREIQERGASQERSGADVNLQRRYPGERTPHHLAPLAGQDLEIAGRRRWPIIPRGVDF